MTSPLRVLRTTGSHGVVKGHGSAEGERSLSVIVLLGGLSVGGAEHQAIALAGALLRRGQAVTIVSLADGPLRSQVEAHGIPLIVLVRPWGLSPAAIPALARVVRHQAPDVMYAFLDVQWLVALAARLLAPRVRVVLGLRSSQYHQHGTSVRSRTLRVLIRQLARYADLLIANSLSGLKDFERAVPRAPHGIVVPNGVDPTRFSPDATGRNTLRDEWSIGAGELIVGHVGRLDPVKNHEMLLDAFALALRHDKRLRLVCIGHGEPLRVASLHALATRLGVAHRVTFAGPRHDLAAVYSALDILALTSVREGFPNVVAESMLCGVPAVVTDTGAAAEIVGPLGEVVPCGDAALFAAGLQRLIRRRSSALSARCRLRILADFTLDRSAALTCAALQSLIPHFHARRS